VCYAVGNKIVSILCVEERIDQKYFFSQNFLTRAEQPLSWSEISPSQSAMQLKVECQ